MALMAGWLALKACSDSSSVANVLLPLAFSESTNCSSCSRLVCCWPTAAAICRMLAFVEPEIVSRPVGS